MSEEHEPGWRDRMQRMSTWPGELTEEALALPSTLKSMRQTIIDLQMIASRLETATKAIEAIVATAEVTGVAPLARRIESAAKEVEKQVDSVQSQLPGPNIIPVQELRKTVEAFTSLIPKPPAADEDDE